MEHSSPRLLLLGGGYTLSRLAARLDTTGFVITSTNERKVEAFRALGYHACRVDILAPDTISSLLQKYPSLEIVIDSVPPPEGGLAPVEKGLQSLARGAFKRVIYLSTTGVFGREDGSWVDEQSSARPETMRGKMRLRIEETWRSLKPDSCSLRLSGIYGPGRGIGRALQAGTYRQIAGDRWANRIHVDDIVRLLEKLVLSQAAMPRVVCVSDDVPALQEQVVSYYCEKFSLPRPPLITREEAERAGLITLLGSQRVSNQLMKKLLGAELTYPSYREGAGTEFTG